MAFTNEQYEALKAAIATGATKVKYKDKEVSYRDLNEMRSILAQMEKELGIDQEKRPRFLGRRVPFYTSKGL